MLAYKEDPSEDVWGNRFLERSRRFDALTPGERAKFFAGKLGAGSIDFDAIEGDARVLHYWARRAVYTYTRAAVDLVAPYQPSLIAVAAVIIRERAAEKTPLIVQSMRFGKILSIYR